MAKIIFSQTKEIEILGKKKPTTVEIRKVGFFGGPYEIWWDGEKKEERSTEKEARRLVDIMLDIM